MELINTTVIEATEMEDTDPDVKFLDDLTLQGIDGKKYKVCGSADSEGEYCLVFWKVKQK